MSIVEANLPAYCWGGGGAVEGEAGVRESQRWAILQPGQQGQGTGSTFFCLFFSNLCCWKHGKWPCTQNVSKVFFIRSQLLGSLILFCPARFFRSPISYERSNLFAKAVFHVLWKSPTIAILFETSLFNQVQELGRRWSQLQNGLMRLQVTRVKNTAV